MRKIAQVHAFPNFTLFCDRSVLSCPVLELPLRNYAKLRGAPPSQLLPKEFHLREKNSDSIFNERRGSIAEVPLGAKFAHAFSFHPSPEVFPEVSSSTTYLDTLAAVADQSLDSAEPPRVQWFVYILRCSNGCLYTGIATDVLKRLAVHNAGKGSAYVRAHRPAALLAYTASENRSTASALECAVKAMTKSQKIALAKAWNAAMGKTEGTN